MKTLIVIILLGITCGAFGQSTKVVQTDSVKSERASINFIVNSKHNYNTFLLKSLVSGDSIKVYAVSESGDTTNVSLRNLATYSDLSSNLITGYEGNQEIMVLHPNIYKLVLKYSNITHTVIIRRRGNNLK